MSYLLDANVFIEASRRYYGFDLVPQFWDWLIDAHSRGVVMTVQQVADEITPGDELHNWFSQLPPTFVEPHTSADSVPGHLGCRDDDMTRSLTKQEQDLYDRAIQQERDEVVAFLRDHKWISASTTLAANAIERGEHERRK